jgi:hypothetical protein
MLLCSLGSFKHFVKQKGATSPEVSLPRETSVLQVRESLTAVDGCIPKFIHSGPNPSLQGVIILGDKVWKEGVKVKRSHGVALILCD